MYEGRHLLKAQARRGRFILMLDNSSKSSITAVQNELQVKLVSSAELSNNVSSESILEIDKGVLYKNIGIAVVDQIELEHMLHCSKKSTNNIVHWEEERIFRTANQSLEQLNKIKSKMNEIEDELLILEMMLNEQYRKDTDSFYSDTWGIDLMKISDSKHTGKGVNVCLLDTGFYAAHPDFEDRTIVGKNFIPEENWDFDGDGHGTHCAGIAVGGVSKTNGIRYGVAKDANIGICKVLSDRGLGTTSGVVDAIDWALEKKYRIISMSLASKVGIGEKPSPIFEQIGQKAMEQNTLIIAAAGNDSNRPDMPRPVSSPANANAIMAIGAIDEDNQIARFSNAGINASNGGKVDLVAPGVAVFSAYSLNSKDKLLYKKMNGTSMATPHIAGLAALHIEANPEITADKLWKKLEKEATYINGLLKRDIGFGLGTFKK